MYLIERNIHNSHQLHHILPQYVYAKTKQLHQIIMKDNACILILYTYCSFPSEKEHVTSSVDYIITITKYYAQPHGRYIWKTVQLTN